MSNNVDFGPDGRARLLEDIASSGNASLADLLGLGVR